MAESLDLIGSSGARGKLEQLMEYKKKIDDLMIDLNQQVASYQASDVMTTKQITSPQRLND